MNNEQFLQTFRESLGPDLKMEVDFDTKLEGIPPWDSVSHVLLMSELELKFGIVVLAFQLSECRTIGDIYALASRSQK